jgi:hypothetical protein
MAHKRTKKLAPKILDRFIAGESLVKISKTFRVSSDTIKNIIKCPTTYGLPFPSDKITKARQRLGIVPMKAKVSEPPAPKKPDLRDLIKNFKLAVWNHMDAARKLRAQFNNAMDGDELIDALHQYVADNYTGVER